MTWASTIDRFDARRGMAAVALLFACGARIGANIGQLDVNHWPGDQEQRADAAIMSDTWHCVELQVDGVASELRVWLDEALPDLTVTDWTTPPGGEGNNTTPLLDWAPTFESVRLGWELGAGEIWYDDVVISTAPIGCGSGE